MVSIGICVRNRQELVGDAILSVAEQDYPKELIELIVVDDGSTDKTLSVVTSSTKNLQSPVKIIHQDWRGLGPSRNVVLNNSNSKYIIWVDSDMVLSKDFLSQQVKFMEEHDGVGIAKGSYGLYKANTVSMLENLEFITTNSSQMSKMDQNALGTGGSIYRTIALKEAAGFNDKIKGSGEDAEAEFRVRKAGWKLARTSAVFYELRRSSWRSIWDEYFWHGKGSMQFLRRETATSLFKFFPPAILFIECMRMNVAYKLTRKKTALLLPAFFVFKRTAWLLGLLNSRSVQEN
jgi:glycosyltransferase involved in cell wall biosynthesis